MKKSLLFLLVAVIFFSCKSNTSTSNNTQSTGAAEVTVRNSAAKAKYAIKSGIVVYKGNIMGLDAVQTLFFDDYGAKDLTQVEMEMMGTKITTLTITRDGFVYNIDPSKKTGTKTSVLSGANSLNFEDMSDEIVKEWNIKKEGKETVMGKECDKFSLDSPSFSMKGYYWVWKGIALKMDVNMSTVKMLLDATSVQENVNIPAEKFEIPADIVIQ
jgi:uncharacterized protein (UPF0333 family)